MCGPLCRYLTDDHKRLDELLRRATAGPGAIDMEAYAEFRKGILRHIAMEEKIVLPAIARAQGGKQAPMAERLRRDHGAIVALLVPSPSPSIIATLQAIFKVHNPAEEDEGGMYRFCEQTVGAETGALLETLKTAPEVPVLPHKDRPEILDATRRAVARAGYEFQEAQGTNDEEKPD